jgi:excisionase family DNA binding protein
MDNGVVTIDEAAKFLRIGRSSLYVLLAQGDLPSVTIGRRSRRVPRAALVAYLESRLSQPTFDNVR